MDLYDPRCYKIEGMTHEFAREMVGLDHMRPWRDAFADYMGRRTAVRADVSAL
jgi:hypothetical protein